VSTHVCSDCGGTRDVYTRLPHGRICTGCRRRRHYHPEPCPGCGATRPLAYQSTQRIVCASCAGAASVFACRECGREDHPYGARRCARCILRERLTQLLTDPRTGQVHTRLRPLFDELVNSERPQTGIWWLRKKPGVGPRLLGQMARGEIDISHDTFRALPSDRAHDYLRSLLAGVGALPPFEVRIERMLPWLATKLEPLPDDQVDLVRRFAHWHVLRQMRSAASQGRLTKSVTDAARERISAAIRFLAFLDSHGTSAATATQDHLERYQTQLAPTLSSEHAFITWLRTSRTNSGLRVAYVANAAPAVTVSDQRRWQHVDRLLHDDTLRLYTRIGGLFTLLFAQPLSRIVAMRTSQVTVAPDGNVHVAFNAIALQMPAVVDQIIRDHLTHRGKSLYVSRDTGWLFPGGNPGHHLATENIRAQLVEIGIKPYESRKAALFQLAAEMPAPVLAELIGLSTNNAADWAGLAARDWSSYIAERAH
jgi:hypothetical protein